MMVQADIARKTRILEKGAKAHPTKGLVGEFDV